MKKISFYIMVLLSFTMLISCGTTKTQELISESSDKLAQVKISGYRETSMDPFKTSIAITGYEQSDTLITEIFAGDLTKENVQFSWTDNTNCFVTFVQQDDTKRIMAISFSPNGNSLKETK